MDGDRASAKATLDKVKSKGTETKYNMGILSVLDGKYDAAVTFFGSAPSYNSALAYVLNGKLNEATQKLEASEDKNSGKGLYLTWTASLSLMYAPCGWSGRQLVQWAA